MRPTDAWNRSAKSGGSSTSESLKRKATEIQRCLEAGNVKRNQATCEAKEGNEIGNKRTERWGGDQVKGMYEERRSGRRYFKRA